MLLELALHFVHQGRPDLAYGQLLARMDVAPYRDMGELHGLCASIQYASWTLAVQDHVKRISRANSKGIGTSIGREGGNEIMDWRTLTSIHESRDLRSLYSTTLGHLLEARKHFPMDPYFMALHMHLLHVRGQRSEARRMVKAAIKSQGQDNSPIYLQLLYLSAWQATGSAPGADLIESDAEIKVEVKEEIKEEIKGEKDVNQAQDVNNQEVMITGKASIQHHRLLPYYRWLREDVEADLHDIFLPYILSLLPLPDTKASVREWRGAQRILVKRLESWDKVAWGGRKDGPPSMEGALWVLLAQVSHRILRTTHQDPEAQGQDAAFWARRAPWWPKLLFSSWPGPSVDLGVQELYGGRLACSLILLPGSPIPSWVCSLVLGWKEGEAWRRYLGIQLTPNSAIYTWR